VCGALLVVGRSTEEAAWNRVVNLRVDDHPDPLGELRRLLSVHRAFLHLARSSELAVQSRFPEALAELDLAAAQAPGDDQVAFWRALGLAGNGRMDEARSEMARIRVEEPRWGVFLRRIADAGLFPNDEALLDPLAPLAPVRP
jgi:uncharacterized Ntn-hydrolase superfamily protein